MLRLESEMKKIREEKALCTRRAKITSASAFFEVSFSEFTLMKKLILRLLAIWMTGFPASLKLPQNSSVSFDIIGFHPLDVLEEINYSMHMASKCFFSFLSHWVEEKGPLQLSYLTKHYGKVGKQRWDSGRPPFPSLPMFFCEMYLDKSHHVSTP